MRRHFTKYPSNIKASVDLPFSKKAKQYAQAAWNKGMSVDQAYDFVFKSMTKDGYSTNHESVPATIQKAIDQLYEEEGDPNNPSTWVWGSTCNDVTASEICYRDRDNDDRVVALDVGMSDEDVKEMLATHPSYYRSTLDRFDDSNTPIKASYPDGSEFNRICDQYASLDPWIPLDEIWDMVNEAYGNEDGLADDVVSWVEHCRSCEDKGIDPYNENIDACDKIETTTTPKYFANMVSASTDDGDYKYYVAGYYDNLMRGLSDNLSTDSFDAVLEFANELANDGCFIQIKNLITGSEVYYDSNVWLEAIKNGDVPEDVFEVTM